MWHHTAENHYAQTYFLVCELRKQKFKQYINTFTHTGYLQGLCHEPVQLYDTTGYRCDFHKPTVDHICVDTMLDLQHSRASHIFHDLQGRLLQLAPSHTNSDCVRKLKVLKFSVP